MPGIMLWRAAGKRAALGASRGGLFATYEVASGPTVNGIYFGKHFFGAHMFGAHFYG